MLSIDALILVSSKFFQIFFKFDFKAGIFWGRSFLSSESNMDQMSSIGLKSGLLEGQSGSLSGANTSSTFLLCFDRCFGSLSWTRIHLFLPWGGKSKECAGGNLAFKILQKTVESILPWKKNRLVLKWRPIPPHTLIFAGWRLYGSVCLSCGSCQDLCLVEPSWKVFSSVNKAYLSNHP